ncbi:MAG: hypothetical protein V1854_04865 [Methanobacteriota archaeon]
MNDDTTTTMKENLSKENFQFEVTPMILTGHSENVKVFMTDSCPPSVNMFHTIEVTCLKKYDLLRYHGTNEGRSKSGELVLQVTKKCLDEIPFDTPIRLQLQDLTGHTLYDYTTQYKNLNLSKVFLSNAPRRYKQREELFRLPESMCIKMWFLGLKFREHLPLILSNSICVWMV